MVTFSKVEDLPSHKVPSGLMHRLIGDKLTVMWGHRGKGSQTPKREGVGRVTRDQVREIAGIKMTDLNANDVEGAMRQIEGTARSMGIEVEAAAKS